MTMVITPSHRAVAYNFCLSIRMSQLAGDGKLAQVSDESRNCHDPSNKRCSVISREWIDCG